MAQYLLSLVQVLVVLGTLGGVDITAQAQTRAVRNKSVARMKAAKPRSHGNVPQQRSLEDILSDQSLWGEGFPSVLAVLPAFSRAGEKQVWIFPDRVLGENKFRNREDAQKESRTLSDALKDTRNLKPRSEKLRAMMASAQQLKVAVALLTDDRTYRVAAEGGPLLRPGLSIDDVRRRLGKEERVTTVVLDDGTERQPVILTLHHYAGGALAFAESNWNPTIGAVDRVLLDTSKISATLF